MCIALFAKNRIITIEYMSESVSFSKDGETTTVIDLLVKNSSDDPISELCLFYPYPLFKNFQTIEDITYSFFKDSSSNLNYFYSFYEDTIELSKKNMGELTLKIPHPKAKQRRQNKYLELTGDVPSHYLNEQKGYELTPHKTITDNNNFWKDFCCITFIPFELKSELVVNKSRWLRLKICTGQSAKSGFTNRELFLRSLFDRLKHHYHFIGPLDILEILCEKFAVFLKHAQKNKQDFTDKHINEIKALEKRIITNGFLNSATKTVIKDFRMNIFTGQFSRPVYINWWGSLRVLNNLPNLYYVPGINRPMSIYQWRTDNIEISNNADKKNKFRICMTNAPLSNTVIFSKLYLICGAFLGFLSFIIMILYFFCKQN